MSGSLVRLKRETAVLPQDVPASLVDKAGTTPAWSPCPCCENYLCNIHGGHAHDCDCPGLEVLDEAGIDPYSMGGALTPQDIEALKESADCE